MSYADVDVGVRRCRLENSDGKFTAEMPSGAPILNRPADRIGLNGSADAMTHRACYYTGNGRRESVACGVGTTPLGVLKKQRGVGQLPQMAEPVTLDAASALLSLDILRLRDSKDYS